VTDQGERYDRIAAGYLRWWAPVLVLDAVATLDLVAGDVAAGAGRILDLGTGTGTLGLAAVQRWPTVRVTGIDVSTEMAHAATLEADRRLRGADRARFESVVGYADELPFEDAGFDVVVSSFVLQLVPSRARALREARRVLRPGGRIAYVTWLAGGDRFAGDEIFDQVLDEAGIGARDDEDGGAPDIASPEAAAQGLRRAGFSQVRATAATLEHRFGVDGYVGFLEEFDEEDLFAGLVERKRTRVVARLRERLAQLPPDDLVLRLPIVRATGVVPRG